MAFWPRKTQLLSKKLGRFQQIALRAQWGDEARHFTPWLEGQIDLLSEAIGMQLEVESREKAVGRYSADLLCKDLQTDHWVVVENQLERTNHPHLGQLLTYAGGLDARAVVWISQRFTEEHRAALDWLNRATTEDFHFFGVEIELWRIDNSAPAPRFNVVVEPNDWAKVLKARSTAATSETEAKQLEYWTNLKAYLEQRDSPVTLPRAAPRHWIPVAMGRAGIHLSAVASRRPSDPDSDYPGETRIELWIADDPNGLIIRQIEEKGSQIEEQLGTRVEFDWLEKKSSKVFIRRGCDVTDETDWPEQHEWIGHWLEAFQKVFRPVVADLDFDPKPSRSQ